MFETLLVLSVAASQVEIIKEKSDYLRHPLMAELVTQEPFISDDAVQLMKFHGSYMQDHREKRAFGQGKFYQFMMRTRQPSGLVTNQLYLTMDDLADQVGRSSGRDCMIVRSIEAHVHRLPGFYGPKAAASMCLCLHHRARRYSSMLPT